MLSSLGLGAVSSLGSAAGNLVKSSMDLGASIKDEQYYKIRAKNLQLDSQMTELKKMCSDYMDKATGDRVFRESEDKSLKKINIISASNCIISVDYSDYYFVESGKQIPVFLGKGTHRIYAMNLLNDADTLIQIGQDYNNDKIDISFKNVPVRNLGGGRYYPNIKGSVCNYSGGEYMQWVSSSDYANNINKPVNIQNVDTNLSIKVGEREFRGSFGRLGVGDEPDLSYWNTDDGIIRELIGGYVVIRFLENVPIGTTWTNEYRTKNSTSIICSHHEKYKITDFYPVYMIENKKFENVVKVLCNFDLHFEDNSEQDRHGVIEVYYAKNIGEIKFAKNMMCNVFSFEYYTTLSDFQVPLEGSDSVITMSSIKQLSDDEMALLKSNEGAKTFVLPNMDCIVKIDNESFVFYPKNTRSRIDFLHNGQHTIEARSIDGQRILKTEIPRVDYLNNVISLDLQGVPANANVSNSNYYPIRPGDTNIFLSKRQWQNPKYDKKKKKLIYYDTIAEFKNKEFILFDSLEFNNSKYYKYKFETGSNSKFYTDFYYDKTSYLCNESGVVRELTINNKSKEIINNEILFLGNVPVGTLWKKYSYSIFTKDKNWSENFKTTPYVVREYLPSFTVGGKTYTDVIVLSQAASQSQTFSRNGGQYKKSTSSYVGKNYTYYAKDIGLIYIGEPSDPINSDEKKQKKEPEKGDFQWEYIRLK